MKSAKLLSVSALLLSAGCAFAGPDVIVGELPSMSAYGSSTPPGGSLTYAFSIGTTSCNRGDVPLNWFANTNQHPVIGQSMYRWKMVNGAGQFEQIGGSHLKHGFTALQGTTCFNDCQAHPNGTRLGVHCSDPYGSGLNGSQSGLGPRDQINAYNGAYPYPFRNTAFGGTTPHPSTIARRLQIKVADLTPAENVGAIYFGEGHYIAPDDALAGNGPNNASYRRFARATSGNFAFTTIPTFGTIRELPAIFAWATAETGVTIQDVRLPSEGVIHVASKVTPIAGGLFHYEYCIHNMNSDLGVRAFMVNFPAGNTECIQTSNVGFRDIDYHSGEPWSGADWTPEKTSQHQMWSTDTFAQNPNANALRWGTSYSFRFDSTRPPVAGTATLGLFKSGATIDFPLSVPGACPCPDFDYNDDGVTDQGDIAALIDDVASGVYGSTIDPDYNQDGSVDQNDVAYLINVIAGGPC